MDLGELVFGRKRLSAAAAPVLTIALSRIECSLGDCTTGEVERRGCTVPPIATRLASRLPAGFTALELQHLFRISIDCGAALHEASPAAAACALCLLLSNAPSSYRRLSLCCQDSLYVDLTLSSPTSSEYHSDVIPSTETLVPFDDVQELVVLLRDCAATHGLSVCVDERTDPGVDDSTVVTLHRAR